MNLISPEGRKKCIGIFPALVFLCISGFIFQLSAQVPIVLYHAGAFGTTESLLIEHMDFLKENDYTPITLDHLLDWIEYDYPLPLRPIVITFDDNYTPMKTSVYPLFKELNFIGINFAHTDYVGWIPPDNIQRPDWPDVIQWEEEGVIFTESHTKTHPHLTSLSEEDVVEELEGSKAAIEANMPGKECLYLAYPYGDYNSFVITKMYEAGYRAGFTTVAQTATRQNNLMEIPRIGVDGAALSTFINRIRFHELPPEPPGEGWTFTVASPNFIYQPAGWSKISGGSESFGNSVYSAEEPEENAGWSIYLPRTGNYRVYAWWPAHHTQSTNTQFIINDSSGTTTLYADQTGNGGTWNLLGFFHFSKEEAAHIHLGTQSDGIMIADGLWIEPVDENIVADWSLF